MECKGIIPVSDLSNKPEDCEPQQCNCNIGHGEHQEKVSFINFSNGHVAYCWKCHQYAPHKKAWATMKDNEMVFDDRAEELEW